MIQEDVLLSQREFTKFGTSSNGSWADRTYTGAATMKTMTSNIYYQYRGNKHYELSNHLGNVLATVQDRKLPVDDMAYSTPNVIDYYQAVYNNFSLYYAFGAPMPGKGYVRTESYRYGFNGQEKDDEVSGEGNSNTAEFWQYESRLGRRFNVDPVFKVFLGSYSCFRNNPIYLIDPNGDNESTHTDSAGKVVAVYNDGDRGVYKHSNESLKDFDPEKMSLTKVGAEKMGETEYWDEFIDPVSGKAATYYRIQFGTSFDPIIKEMHEKAKGMDWMQIAKESSPGGLFDIKVKYAKVGSMLNGKYVTSRSAGNFLAGYNACSGTYKGISITFNTFQQLAGALHIESSRDKKLQTTQKVDIVSGLYIFRPQHIDFGAHVGCSDPWAWVYPYYGELEYQYRMSLLGWAFGLKNI
ncbi:MAG: hypothetical protein IT245_08920 [Bacteroidia bacterium]|nr:hypothetical protein [Bacteroidia bacterium]